MFHRSRSPKPTVVLVHGAFADSTSWNDVARELLDEGHPVVAAANPLRGLSSDAAYVREVLAGIEGPVVLVGHSYGGSVITAAAVGADNVRALVYVAAFIPDKGESALDLAARFPGSSLGEALHPVPVTLPGGSPGVEFTIDRARFPHQFAADVPEGVARLMAVTQRPVTGAALEEPAPEPGWRTLPSWAVVATEDLNIPATAQRYMAERAGAQVMEVQASHAAAVSHPREVTRVVTAAAASVKQ
ncbi:alpha/beta hydrolase [Streptomyces viridodiastaticus]|uniref:alpha/beta fold hydrolase n=1 Tax=Streptomyces albogriseolus TaxID=1887 RepID=UPI002250F9D2|nr:alpha/beta hydrolase [Streptomyces viridodiastaticus]MCX4565098.1 alpha/beta hydrolase [Streptomyces viridodiastaticus]